jgi:hypothetical protein
MASLAAKMIPNQVVLSHKTDYPEWEHQLRMHAQNIRADSSLSSDAELLLLYDPVNDLILKMKRPNIPDENCQPHEVTLYQIRMLDYKEILAKADELRAFILQTLSKNHHFVISQAVSLNATARKLLYHIQRVLRPSNKVLEHLLLTEYDKLRAKIRFTDIVT